MIFSWIRGSQQRRRRICGPSHCQSAHVERLESRQLLVATLLSDIPDVAPGSAAVAVVLADHFDDPAISGSTAKVVTPLGTFFMETFDGITPLTAANFVDITAAGNYNDMFFHRSVPGFVVQGGGFKWRSGSSQVAAVDNNGPITNEFDNWFDPNIGGRAAGSKLNTRGTVAMAKQGGNANSATSQWFVSLADNSENLDNQNGGFTVFARVLFDGMTVVDSIAALQRVNAGEPFDSLPVRSFQAGSAVTRDNVVGATTSIVGELSYLVSDNSHTDLITASIVDGVLHLSPISGQSGTAEISIQATDLQGNSVTSRFTVTVTAPAATTITGPGNGDSPRPKITWNAIGNADTYELWVNQVGGQSAVIHELAISGSTFTPAVDLADGAYRAWVRSTNSAGTSGWSSAHSFVVGLQAPAAVQVVSPATSTVATARPVISWNEADHATTYDLWVNHVGVKNQIVREASLTASSYTPDQDLPDGTYRVWVMAKNAAGNSGWSQPMTFQIATGNQLKITGPTGSATPRPEIKWSGQADQVYELWVNQIGGTARIIHEAAVTGVSFIPGYDLSEGPYRAWLRHRPANAAPGAWTAAFDFTVGVDNRPGTTAIAAVTNLNTARPTFAISAASNAVRYELWVNKVGGAARVIHVTNITELQFTSSTDIVGGTYRAWLRAFNSDDTAGAWAAAFDFEIA